MDSVHSDEGQLLHGPSFPRKVLESTREISQSGWLERGSFGDH